MKPAPFVYRRALSLDEAVAVLTEHGDQAKVLAGGQSLIAQLNRRSLTPAHLVDITRAIDGQGIEHTDGHVEIKSGVRQAEAEDSELLARSVPLLTQALAFVAYREIRNAGTVCGSAAFGDALGEIPTVVLTLGGELVTVGPRGRRVIPADRFFLGPLRTALAPDEVLKAVRFPVGPPSTGTCFRELAPRKGGYAIAGAAATVATDHGVIVDAAVGLLGVAPTPVRCPAAERLLVGCEPSDALFAEAAEVATVDIDPPDDVHATASYRRHLASALSRQALAGAVARIQEER